MRVTEDPAKTEGDGLTVTPTICPIVNFAAKCQKKTSKINIVHTWVLVRTGLVIVIGVTVIAIVSSNCH